MNDTRVTNYALGEMQGAEREAFEKELATSEELQRELKETIDMVQTVGNLEASAEGLLDDRRISLREECLKNLKTRRNATVKRAWIVGTLAAAACLLLIPLVIEKREESKQGLAKLDDQSAQRESKDALVSVKISEAASQTADHVDEAALPSGSIVVADNGNSQSVTTPASRGEMDAMMKSSPLFAPADSSLKQAPVVGTESSLAKNDVQGRSESLAAAPAAAPPVIPRSETVDEEILAMKQESSESKPLATADVRTATRVDDSGKLQDLNEPGYNGVVARLASPKENVIGGEAAIQRPSQAGMTRGFDSAYSSASASFNTEAYDAISENAFLEAVKNPLSTFSIDVDTASYSNVRRFLQSEQLPPSGAVRIEELINYFPYNYPQPEKEKPFSVNVEVSRAPWEPSHELVRIGLKGRDVPVAERPASNLVFLIDVSGSMQEPAKLPLLQRSLKALVEKISPKDHVAIVVYAGSSGLVLPPTSGEDKERILESIDKLEGGGSTNGAAGIQLAYQIARENFLKKGSNRVILCTDGDFNVGVTSQSELVELIEKERASGVFLSVLGFGTGNLKDSTMEQLADKGNGNYAYIDTFSEGRKVLVEQMGATLFTIAKDVKIQVEFNPARVAGYRLVGYENRLLAKEDFNNDKKDAGEIGAGHTVTALYEVVPAGQSLPGAPSVDPLKYQTPPLDAPKSSSDELLTVKLRYKAPDGDKSQLLSVPVKDESVAFEKASPDFQFATAVAAFGMKLRNSPNAGDVTWKDIQAIVRRSLGEDPGSYRAEFLTLVEKASKLSPPDTKE